MAAAMQQSAECHRCNYLVYLNDAPEHEKQYEHPYRVGRSSCNARRCPHKGNQRVTRLARLSGES